MKFFLYVVIGLFLVLKVSSQDLILYPTKGFNEFIFGVSKASEVKAYFSNVQFDEKAGGGVSCGDADPMIHKSLSLINDSVGIRLYFSSSWIENSKRKTPCLDRVVLTKNAARFVDDNVEIGKSNLNSIKKIYGEEKGRDRVKHSLLYEKLGLLFIFDSKDILTRIQIQQAEIKK
jgi:hypothetical protein